MGVVIGPAGEEGVARGGGLLKGGLVALNKLPEHRGQWGGVKGQRY